MSVDRLLSIYGQPVQSWPGEEDVDAEARANFEAMNPHLAQAKAPKLRPDETFRGTFLPFRETLDGKHEWAVPGFLMDVADSARAIKDSSRRPDSGGPLPPMMRPSQYSPEVFERMLELGMAGALTGITGNIPRLLTKPTPGTTELGIFGGRSAKTANQEMLAKAEQMAADGAPREEIWQATGWFQGPDKKWRFEIDDSKSSFGPGQTLGEVLSHKELDNAYPAIAGIETSMRPGSGGSYTPSMYNRFEERTIPESIYIGQDQKSSTPRSVGLHEAQHAVQEREGFASGANPGRFPPVKEDRAMLTDANVLARMASGAGGDMDAAKDRFRTMFKRDPALGAESVALSGEAPDAILARRDALLDPYEAYRRTAGETEARAVQARANLSPEERLARPPWMDYDVPESQQIVRFGNEGMSSAEKVPLDMSPEARLARAREMGFDTDRTWYHGTNVNGAFDAFEVGKPTELPSGRAVWLAADPDHASSYAMHGPNDGSARVIPTYLRVSNTFDAYANPQHKDIYRGWVKERQADGKTVKSVADDGFDSDGSPYWENNPWLVEKVRDAGYDSLIVTDGNHQVGIGILDPSNIRSVNADFDPSLSSSPQIMASMDVPVGGAAGAASAQAAQQQQRMVDALGYYSAAVEAAKGLKQARGTPEQMLAQLRKIGVKDAEIQATGLDQLFASGKAVTRDQIVEHLEKNKIALQEAIYAGADEEGRIGLVGRPWEVEDNVLAQTVEINDTEFTAFYDKDAGNAWAEAPDGTIIPGTGQTNRQTWDNAYDAIRAYASGREVPDGAAGPSRFAHYSLDPKNPTYRETVLHLPEKLDDLQARKDALMAEVRTKPGEARLQEINNELFSINQEVNARKNARFQSGHFDEPNIVGHMMTSETYLPGTGQKVFTLDQIQSDWGQKLRDGGVRDEAKIAELNKAYQASSDVYRQRLNDAINAIESKLPAQQASQHVGTDQSIERWLRGAGMAAEADKFASAVSDMRLKRAEFSTANESAIGHPLVNTTDQWTNVVLRRAIRQAAESGADYIAVPTGDTVLSYNPGDTHGMNTFYNQIVPKNLKNLLIKIDKKSPPPQRIDTLDSPSGATGLGEGFTLFPLTEKVKKEVMEGGQPLFAKGGSVAGPALRRLAQKSARTPQSVDEALDR